MKAYFSLHFKTNLTIFLIRNMAQSKKLSIIESTTNTMAGLLTAFGIQLVIYPVLNIEVSLNQNIIITLVFFIASVFRGYLIRRIFNSLK